MSRALISVTDKKGLAEFARALADIGFEIVSTGGTAKAIREAGVEVTDVSQVTGFAEMLDGRVKTLHPMIHGGLLGDRANEDHVAQMAGAGIEGFDLLCVNLYEFHRTVTGPHKFEDAVESIDIGGPAMIRSAAKNCSNVTVVVDPADYDSVVASTASNTIADLRRSLAAKAFRHTAYYDAMVARYMTEAAGDDPFTETVTIGLAKHQTMRYGENPHQTAALYADPLLPGGITDARQLWGKELSYNNVLDSDAAWELVCDLAPDSCAIIKHGNPCGAATASSPAASFELAKKSDPVSAFGGVAAFHGTIDGEAATAMTEKGNFLEVVVAEAFTAEALELFKNRSGWGQRVRLLEASIAPDSAYVATRSIRGGVLRQLSDEDPGDEWRFVTEPEPSEALMAALRFAWRIIPHIKSNAIVVCSQNRLLGIGAGQMNRVQSVRLALEQAGSEAAGAVLASDAFFPFPDSIQTAAEAGIAAIVQPGGSKNDDKVIAAAAKFCIPMAFTGVRHFRH